MKTITLCVLILTSTCLMAQSSIPEPQWVNEIQFVNPVTLKGEALERQTANRLSKMKGIAGVKSVYSISGRNSSKVFALKDNTIQFVYKVADNNVDPRSMVQLVRLEIEDLARQIDFSSYSYFNSSASSIDAYDFKAEKHGKSSYILTFTGLPEGEYGFVLSTNGGSSMLGNQETIKMHCFTLGGAGQQGLPTSNFMPGKDDIQLLAAVDRSKSFVVLHALNSKNQDSAVSSFLRSQEVTLVEAAYRETAGYEFIYFHGPIPRRGPDFAYLQIQLVDKETEQPVVKFSKKAAGQKGLEEALTAFITQLK